ncbi:hypothetical protein RI367_005024 [Sorochytrium milnesiophthora]
MPDAHRIHYRRSHRTCCWCVDVRVGSLLLLILQSLLCVAMLVFVALGFNTWPADRYIGGTVRDDGTPETSAIFAIYMALWSLGLVNWLVAFWLLLKRRIYAFNMFALFEIAFALVWIAIMVYAQVQQYELSLGGILGSVFSLYLVWLFWAYRQENRIDLEEFPMK